MLYLHIGTGKAGSTSIQRFLIENRQYLHHHQLRTFGIGNAWKLAAATGTEKAKQYFVAKAKMLSEGEFSNLNSVFWREAAAEIQASGAANFVASSEFIYQFVWEQDEILMLCQRLKQLFGEVKILINFRNQIDYLKSIYAQRVKGLTADVQSFESFMRNQSIIDNEVHYADQAKLWINALEKESIDAAVFDRRNFLNQNLIDDFCLRIGQVKKHSSSLRPQKIVNVSPGYSQLQAYRYLNRLGLNRPQHRVWGKLRSASHRLINRIVPTDEFPSDFDDQVLSTISEGNLWLNQQFFQNQRIKLPVL